MPTAAKQPQPQKPQQITWKKQPKQIDFLRSCGLSHPFEGGKPKKPQARVILFGGSAGGGKSDALLVAGIIAAVSFPGANIGYFRREYPQLEGPGGAIMRSHDLLTGLAKYNGSLRRWKFANGSILQFCHSKNETDIYSYQSQQFDVVLIDESTHFSRFQVRYLLTRNRATVKGITPFMALASNPGNIGHGWHKQEFIDVGVPGQPVDVEVEPGRVETHLFIPSRLQDNQILEQRDPGYRATLESQPEEIRRALLDGDWDVFAGQYFKAFRRDLHSVDPFPIPDDWTRFASMDWGYAAPCAVHWHAVEPSSYRVYTYREMYVTQMRPAEVAERFLEISRDDGRIAYLKASPDMWQERGLASDAEAGESIADEFSSRGILIEMADNRRVIGWTRVREYLSLMPDEKPAWQCFTTCDNLLRTLPELVHDERNVEDVDGNCEDHAPESLRYALMSRPKPADLTPIIPAALQPGTGIKEFHFDREMTREQMLRDEFEDMEDEGKTFFDF